MFLRPMKLSDLFVYPSFYSLFVNNLLVGSIITIALIVLFFYILYLIISNAVERGISKALEKHSIKIEK